MADLTSKQIKNTYKDLLTINSGTDNQGLESSLKTVSDGEGVESAIQLSTTTLKIPSGKTLEIAGTLNSVNATLTGDLAVGDDLTVTDLISGNSLAVTAGATFGGGYGSTGVTISTDGNIQANGTLTADGLVTTSGGYVNSVLSNSKGLTIDGTTGGISTNGNVVIGSLLASGGASLTVNNSGQTALNTTGNVVVVGTITCSDIKTGAGGGATTGTVGGNITDTPKVKFTKDGSGGVIGFTVVDDSDNDVDVFTVAEDGDTEIKDKDGDIKLEVKSTGTVKYKSKTTTELNSITGTPGELVFDSTIGGFKVWES